MKSTFSKDYQFWMNSSQEVYNDIINSATFGTTLAQAIRNYRIKNKI